MREGKQDRAIFGGRAALSTSHGLREDRTAGAQERGCQETCNPVAQLVVHDPVSMKSVVLNIVLLSLLLEGCSSPVVSKGEFQRIVASHAGGTVCAFRYMGSQEAFHYFKLTTLFGTRTYRVADTDWRLGSTFPLTRDETQWRFVNGRGDFLTAPPMIMYYVPKEFM